MYATDRNYNEKFNVNIKFKEVKYGQSESDLKTAHPIRIGFRSNRIMQRPTPGQHVCISTSNKTIPFLLPTFRAMPVRFF